ncbi:unnamed protein product [Moneuplotes crassus]|uniref:Uncharacterized protein n=1 Tax=Euplotes crassus TaxID=5936 RepID=A0AAD1Y592_EUPCR|nr:unnamed protein product [Moneuplotes crassus]
MSSSIQNKLTYKKAWEEESNEESKGCDDFNQAQRYSEKFLLKNPQQPQRPLMKFPSDAVLNKIVENSSKNIFICNEEDEKIEEEKNKQLNDKLRLSEVPLQEESKDQIISGENLDQIVSFSSRKPLAKKIVPNSESPLRKSRTRESLKKRKALRKRIIFTSQEGSERLESDQNLLPKPNPHSSNNQEDYEQVSEASSSRPSHLSNQSNESDFTHEDVEHLLK